MPQEFNAEFANFLAKEKFISEGLYSGVLDLNLKPILVEKINEVAIDFQKVSNSDSPNNKMYQDRIKLGLDRFSDIYLDIDTEDRERICEYFEELMDIVGLESSNGLLNEFMYGFNPN